MSSMIERVARGLARRAWPKFTAKDVPFIQYNMAGGADRYCDECWSYYAADARAAIEAMREPTKAMIEAGWADAQAEDAGATWKSMIDAALAEPAPKPP